MQRSLKIIKLGMTTGNTLMTALGREISACRHEDSNAKSRVNAQLQPYLSHHMNLRTEWSLM
jgi:hypothetical protein